MLDGRDERKVPTRSFEVIVLVALSLIAGVIAATYASPSTRDAGPRRTLLRSATIQVVVNPRFWPR